MMDLPPIGAGRVLVLDACSAERISFGSFVCINQTIRSCFFFNSSKYRIRAICISSRRYRYVSICCGSKSKTMHCIICHCSCIISKCTLCCIFCTEVLKRLTCTGYFTRNFSVITRCRKTGNRDCRENTEDNDHEDQLNHSKTRTFHGLLLEILDLVLRL